VGPIARLLLPLFTCFAVLAAGPASALDPARSLGQYKHTNWSADDGVPSVVSALGHGPDGYLWMGSRDGLVRFDGVSFETIAPERRIEGRAGVSAVLAARDGSVWAGYASGGIAVYRNGVLRDAGMPNPDGYVMSLVQSKDGAIWAMIGRPDMPLVRYADGRWEEIGVNRGVPRGQMIGIRATRDGALWITTTKSVHVLKPRTRDFERLPVVPDGHAALSEDPAGRVWLSDLSGSRAITGADRGRGVNYPTPGFLRAARATFDKDGNLWGMTGTSGIFRVRAPNAAGEASPAAAAGRVEVFGAKEGLASNITSSILEDREGNIWVGSNLGLDRFRAAKVVVEPRLTQIATWGYTLLGASDGAVYVGQASTVYRVLPGRDPEPILQNVSETEAMCEDRDGGVWIVLVDGVVHYRAGRTSRIPQPPVKDPYIQDCAVDRDGALWLTGLREGMLRWKAGRWQAFLVPPPAGDPVPMLVRPRRDGGLLAYLGPDTLSWIDYPRRSDVVFSPRRSVKLNTFAEGPDGVLLGGDFGLARLRPGRIETITSERNPAFGGVSGIVQTRAGETWLLTRAGIVQISTPDLDRAFSDRMAKLHPRILDVRDGLPGVYIRDGAHDAAQGGDGRIWFATTGGVVWVDPSHLHRNTLAPTVAIGALKAAGVTYRDPKRVVLPKGTSSGEIDYTALGLSIPERVRFRYQLEGLNKGWVDPGARRQMFFTNLGPGTYRFRVIAANDDGLWNTQGATLEFTIPPTFFQSRWFLLICALALGGALWLGYSIRLRHVTARVREGLEVRLAERERIARELHDTLLQGFQGLVLRFQSVADRIPPDAPIRPIIDDALERADAVMIEGRERVLELRSAAAHADLAQSLIDAAAELSIDRPAKFELTVEGRPRDLHPVARDEVQRIGEEAIRNAFHHAQARAIEVVLAYHAGALRLDVRDDGVGLPDEVVSAGERVGHYGLTGMRERAQRIGGVISVISRRGAGTEVLLSIPGRSAYATRRGGQRALQWISRILGLKG
jgi:signal transduction histidine kinase/ligand-binding sensor domain-containing protein